MLNLLKALRQDEHGVILSTEIVIVGSLLVIGLISGLACLQKSVNGELQDLAGAIGALDQSYSYSSFRKAGTYGRCCAYTAGSSYVNCENNSQKHGDIVGCCETTQVQASACGACGGVSAAGCSSCGSSPCGSAPCGSTPCGKAPCGTVNGARVIDTGVPRMKVTEYPLSPRVEEAAPVVVPAQVVVPGCNDCKSTESATGSTVQHSSSDVIIVPAEQSAPVVTPATPAPQAAPLVPVPDKSVNPPQA
ncbi:MAG: hypothetical protein U0936_14490 [Planctomycetaceae bacterium]